MQIYNKLPKWTSYKIRSDDILTNDQIKDIREYTSSALYDSDCNEYHFKYLSNDLITNLGWCTEDGLSGNGMIPTRNPTTKKILSEWWNIALMFPYLDIQFQLGEYAGDRWIPLVDIIICDGTVEIVATTGELVV